MKPTSLDLKRYAPRVASVEALQLTRENLADVAIEIGATLLLMDGQGRYNPFLIHEGHMGRIKGTPGMWLVKKPSGWLLLRDDRFRSQYRAETEENEDKPKPLEFCPPYDR